MPEMFFKIRWPDASESDYYSPSLIIREYFSQGQVLELADFLDKSRLALTIASDRVKAKYGFSCTRAHSSLAAIESRAKPFAANPAARIEILEFS